MMSTKHFMAILLSLIVSLISFVGMLSLHNQKAPKDNSAEVKKLEKKVADVEKLGTLQKQIDDADKKLADLNAQIKEAEKKTKELIAKKNQPKPPVKITKKPELKVDKNGLLVVNVDALNFRKGSTLKSGVYRILKQGEKLKNLKNQHKSDGFTWTKVKDSKGKIGWVATQFTK